MLNKSKLLTLTNWPEGNLSKKLFTNRSTINLLFFIELNDTYSISMNSSTRNNKTHLDRREPNISMQDIPDTENDFKDNR